MTEALYAVVILAAATAGAVAVLGGDVIIKPLLGLIGSHGASSIGVYSAVAVFAMCLVSLTAQRLPHWRMRNAAAVAAVGSSLGRSRCSSGSAAGR